ncbi:MAG: DMT family transporter [Burkholderiales bacterium]
MAATKPMAIASLLSGAVVWGIIWYPYRLLEQAGIGGAFSSFLTYGGSLLLCLFFIHKVEWRKIESPWLLLAIALSAGWTNLAYVLAVIHGEVMRVLLLFYLAPLWTILFARILLTERLRIHGYLIVFLSITGAIVMLWRPQLGLPVPANGAEWLGLSAGVTFALANVLSRRAQNIDVAVKSMSVFFGAAVLSGLALAILPNPTPMPLLLEPRILMLVAITVFFIFAVTLTVQYGLSHAPANQAIVIFLFELVVAALTSWWLVGELMSLQEWIGGLLIVAASLFSGEMEERGV